MLSRFTLFVAIYFYFSNLCLSIACFRCCSLCPHVLFSISMQSHTQTSTQHSFTVFVALRHRNSYSTRYMHSFQYNSYIQRWLYTSIDTGCHSALFFLFLIFFAAAAACFYSWYRSIPVAAQNNHAAHWLKENFVEFVFFFCRILLFLFIYWSEIWVSVFFFGDFFLCPVLSH